MLDLLNREAVLELEHHLAGRVCIIPSDLAATGDDRLLLSLEQERSLAGEALVDALWFEKDVQLWLRKGDGVRRLTLRPWRCHIVGRQFSMMLMRARERKATADISAVWEFIIKAEEAVTGPVPQIAGDALTGEREVHLDMLLG